MASEEREGGMGDLGGELYQGDRADVGAKSGQSPIQITRVRVPSRQRRASADATSTSDSRHVATG
jgi:hypothetical protein